MLQKEQSRSIQKKVGIKKSEKREKMIDHLYHVQCKKCGEWIYSTNSLIECLSCVKNMEIKTSE